jgi:glycosyltransferase involved in cell wall biosynthesis
VIARQRRVLMVTYLFPPSTEIGGQACAQIAAHLPRYGWEPVVLTVRERHIEHVGVQAEWKFPGTVIRAGMLPHPFMIYRRLKTALGRSDTGTPWNPTVLTTIGGLRRWAYSLLGLPDLYTGWIVPAVIGGLNAVQRYGIEHILSSAPPWTSHLVALSLARLTGLPWTAHFRDPWTDPWADTHQSKPVSGLSARVETALEKMVVRRADRVVCVTEEHTSLLRHAHPEAPADKFVTIPNGFDGAEWQEPDAPRAADGSACADTFVITYAGNLYEKRDPGPLFRALRALIAAGEILPERLRVDLIGRCEAARGRRVSDIADECGLGPCLRLTGPLSRAETLRRMRQSDLLLLLAEGLSVQIPGKTYEYLRAGRPILALTSEGAVARLLRATGGAWVVDPADEMGVATAVHHAYRRWQEHDGPAPDPAVVASFDRRVLAGRFAQLFDEHRGSRPEASAVGLLVRRREQPPAMAGRPKGQGND